MDDELPAALGAEHGETADPTSGMGASSEVFLTSILLSSTDAADAAVRAGPRFGSPRQVVRRRVNARPAATSAQASAWRFEGLFGTSYGRSRASPALSVAAGFLVSWQADAYTFAGAGRPPLRLLKPGTISKTSDK